MKQTVLKSEALLYLLHQWPEQEFIQEVRMTKLSFQKILRLIEDHEVFKSRSRNKQKAVWIQLVVTLRRLGSSGNGTSLGRSSRWAGIGQGTVSLYMKRCFTALLLIKHQIIVWPDEEERNVISNYFYQNYGLRGCVVLMESRPFQHKISNSFRVITNKLSVGCIFSFPIVIRLTIIAWHLFKIHMRSINTANTTAQPVVLIKIVADYISF